MQTSSECRKYLSVHLIYHKNSSSLSAFKTSCTLDNLLLQFCRWPVNNTSSGYYTITKDRRRKQRRRLMIFVKDRSEIKKNKLQAWTLDWSTSLDQGLLGGLLHHASEVGKRHKANKKDWRRKMQRASV